MDPSASRTGSHNEGELAVEFARALAANFAREVARKESSEEEKSSHDSHEPQEQNRLKPLNFGAESPGTGTVGTPQDRSLIAPANNRKGPRLASSRFRGCTRHRRTKRYEAHIWDQRQQRYLGGFDKEVDAGKAHDVMALKCRTSSETPQLNFPMENYMDLLPLIDLLPKEEVVAQLRQLNRTAPRPKARKPPSKPRSSPNLAGLGKTRSGGLLLRKRGETRPDGQQMLMSEEAMAPFCRANQLMGGDPSKQLPHANHSAFRGLPGHAMQSAFATQKDVPLPLHHWGAPLSLDCEMPPDLSDSLTHLGDPSDLLVDFPTGMVTSPKFASGLRSPPHDSLTLSLKSPGPLYVGRMLGSPKHALSRMARDAPALYNSHAHSLPEPLPMRNSYDSIQSRSPLQSLTIRGEAFNAGQLSSPRMKAPAKFNAQLERGYSLRAGSMHQSAESVGTQIGAMSDVAYGKLFHHQIPAWDSPAILNSSGTGRLPMNEHKIFGGLQNEGGFWEHGPQRAAGSYQLSAAHSQTGGDAWLTGQLPQRLDMECDQRVPSLRSTSGNKVEHQSSFSSANTGGAGILPHWEKTYLNDSLADTADLFPMKNEQCSAMFSAPADAGGMSFTQMMTQEVPTSDQLDAAVMDVMGTWSP